MFHNARTRLGTALVAVAFGMTTGAALGADVFVDINSPSPCPGLGTAADPYCSIQGAIGNAVAGDTIHVAAGVYNEKVNISKANLTLLATDGANNTTITANALLVPTVIISANNATLGLPGQGFEIIQQSNAPSSIAVRLDGSVIGNAPVTIQDNTIVGTDSGRGLFVEGGVTNAHLIVRNNTFSKDPGAAFSFNTVIDFGTTLLGSIPASVDASTVDLLNNTATDFRVTGIRFGGIIDNSTVTVNPSTYTAEMPNIGATIGVTLPFIGNNATVNILDSTFENVQRGVSSASKVETASALTIRGCTFAGMTDFGIVLDSISSGSSLTIEGNTMEADPAGMDDGVSVAGGVMPTSAVVVRDNEITGFSDVGVRIGSGLIDLMDGSTLTVSNNTLTAHVNGAQRGVLTSGPNDSSAVTINENEIEGFTVDGIFVGPTDGGSTVTINGNTLTAHGSGALNAIQMLTGLNQASATINENVAAGFTRNGLLIPLVVGNSTLIANENEMDADAGGCDFGVFIGDIEDGSEVMLNKNSFMGFTDTGFLVNDDINDGSSVIITNSTFIAHANGSTNGVRVNNGLQDGSHMSCERNAIEGFTNTGYYTRDVNEGSLLSCNRNMLTGHDTGAGSGIFIDRGVDEGSNATCNDNTITNFTDQGIYSMVVRIGGSFSASGNEMTAHAGGADFGIKIKLQITDGASGHFNSNKIAGFTDSGIFVGGTDDSVNNGSLASFNNNLLTAHANGANNGIFLNGGIDESPVTMRDNVIEGFEANGIYIGGGAGGSLSNASTLLISANTLTAGVNGADHGINFNLNGLVDGLLRGGSSLAVTGNNINGFLEDAFRAGIMEGGASVRITNNICTAHATGATQGILLSGLVVDGNLAMRHNTISNIGVGISVAGVQNVPVLDVYGNNLTASAGGQYGIYFGNAAAGASIRGGVTAPIRDNVITDFTDASVYFEGQLQEGVTLNLTGNEMIGAAQHGVRFGAITNGVAVNVVANRVDGFVQGGLDFTGGISFSLLLVEQNHFNGENADIGMDLEGVISNTSHVNVPGNCFANVLVGVEVSAAIQDASFVTVNDNDLAGVANIGVNNLGGDLVHRIDGTNNWWGTANGPGVDGNAVKVGFVNVDPFLVAEPDSDNDGVPNCQDPCLATPPPGLPANADGCSFCQLDTDGDNVKNCEDVCAGLDDRIDSNGNGTPDCAEFPPVITGPPDDDDDDITNPFDLCPNTALDEPVDENGCSTLDEDGDGVTNDFDFCANTLECAFGNLDDDGCPVDMDGDGLVDGCDVCPDDDDLADTDGDGLPNCLDPCPDDGDTDGDGVDDCLDQCPDDADKLEPGVCDCGTPDTDGDSDTVVDCNDNCPNDANADQADADGDGIGDVCDATPTPPAPPAPAPAPAPTPTPDQPVGPLCAFCGIGCPQMMIMSFLGLAMMGFTQRRRRFF